jgi:hypothetical protein
MVACIQTPTHTLLDSPVKSSEISLFLEQVLLNFVKQKRTLYRIQMLSCSPPSSVSKMSFTNFHILR